MTLKAAIFDIGGTLIKYPVPLTEMGKVFEEYCADVGLSLEEASDWFENYKSAREFGLKTLCEATFMDALRKTSDKYDLRLSRWEIINILRFMYDKAFKDKAELIPGAKELLVYIKGRGLVTGLISNTAWPGSFHEEDLRRFGILHYFDSRIWTSEDGLRKPHKALFLKILRQLGVNYSEAVYTGDTFSRDVEGPNGIGIPAIWITDEQPKDIFAGWRAKDLLEVKEIIQKLL